MRDWLFVGLIILSFGAAALYAAACEVIQTWTR